MSARAQGPAPRPAALAAAAETARLTMRALAERRLAPTPENYARLWCELSGEAPAEEAEAVRMLRETVARVLVEAVVPRLGYDERLAAEARDVAERFRAAATLAELRDASAALRQFWIHLELRGETVADLLGQALALLQLVVRNFAELAPDERWLRPQLARLEELLAQPPRLETLREAERGLREVIYRQGALRRSMEEAETALRNMVGVFLERLGLLSASTGEFSARIGEYAKKIAAARDLASLASLVARLLEDTRSVQADLLRSRDELLAARQEAQAQAARVAQLERDLEAVTALVRQDSLTGVLNRRGLEEAYAAEAARCERRASPLSLAVMDLDNFKQLNDRLGHAGGDAALGHLARTARAALRPSDTIARWGGEEFVILLPDTARDDALRIMQRLQRALTRRFFLHNNERVLITFSAGVAERLPGESRDALIARADRAMYEAKKQGRNRVVAA